MIWSAVHGLAVLLPGLDSMDDKAGTDNVDQLLDHYTDLLANGLFGANAKS